MDIQLEAIECIYFCVHQPITEDAGRIMRVSSSLRRIHRIANYPIRRTVNY